METVLKTSPTIEPITLAQLKEHLRIDSGTLADNLALSTCTASGSHPVTTGYTLYGTAIDVLGKEAVIYLQPVNNGTGATVDVKIQESDTTTSADFVDWKVTSVIQAFAQVTEANDTVVQEIQYTGSKKYVRTASKTLVNACEFGTSVLVNAATTIEDTALTRIISSARREVEDITSRALLSQTWYYYLDAFPCEDRIYLPFGNLQSATSVKYKDSAGTETTMTAGTDYLVETNRERCGSIVLPYGLSWPSFTAYPSNPITIEFVCGWTAAASIPENIIAAVLFEAERQYFHGDRDAILLPAIKNLTRNYRLWREF